ncbi:MAG: hypothetical protein JXQ27_18965 [Acidobacteria bacterium]|nr:hypothetical protein [Acidobacteriota bacterium]
MKRQTDRYKCDIGAVQAPGPLIFSGRSRHLGKWYWLLAALVLLAGHSADLRAFIPQSSVSVTNDQTRVLRWAQTPVDFVMDGGLLGGEDGFPLVANALNAWDDVPTASRVGGELYIYVDDFDNPIDFTADNFGLDYGIIDDGINEIVFDETGEILELLGVDPEYTAGVSITIENMATQTITDAMLIVNGGFASSTILDLEATAIHELGHLYGLSHTFIGAINSANTEPGFYPVEAEFIPTMYPYQNPLDDQYHRTLEWDDMAGISFLYPETVHMPPDYIAFGADTGTLRGRIFYRNQVPVTGVHVRAVNADDPTIQLSGLAGADGLGTGLFDIPGVPPGPYYLVVEGIDGRDGIDAATIEDDGIGVCSWDGFPDFDTPVAYTVREDEVLSGFQLSISHLPLDDNDVVEFGLPDTVDFTFMGLDCRRVFLYSNGMISFNRYENPHPEITWTDGDLFDFLARPMAKICPLRTDLDPAGNTDGSIDVTTAGSQITFSFHQVPIVGNKSTATFDLVLDDAGWFRFDYGATGAPVALVGYTSGVYDAGGIEAASDFVIWSGGTVPTAHNRLMYQLLDSSWLDNTSLTFPAPATDPFPVRNRLIYPWLAAGEDFNLGFAVVSNVTEPIRLRITAYDYDGFIHPVTPGSENPVLVDLGPLEQFVIQAGQLFDFSQPDPLGWILVETDEPDPYGIQGFFLIQSGTGGMLDALDGAVASGETGLSLVFPRFTGEAGEYTEITVVNPNPLPAEVTTYLYRDDGSESVYTDVLPANAISIFPLDGSGEAYVVVDSTQPVTGFAMNFNLNGSLAGQPGRFLWESRPEMVSPHFIHLDGNFASRLDLVNPNDDPVTVTIELVDRANQTIGNPVEVIVEGWFHSRVDITPDLFGFDPQALTDGWIWAAGDRSFLGTMTFGDPTYGLSQTTLPLLWAPQYTTIHSHLAQGEAGGVDYLTGLALLSLDPVNDYFIDVYDSDGFLQHGIESQLGAGERGIGLLDEWMPDGPWPQVAGYLAGGSVAGLYAYEIFTTTGSEFYAAVPAQKYLPVQRETDDFDNGWPDYAVPLDGFPLEVRGEFPLDDAGYYYVDLGDGYIDQIEDLYAFEVTRAGWYMFALHPDNRWCDVDLYLFDDEWFIVESAATGVPNTEYIQVYLEPGKWYVGVSLFDLGWFEEGGYHLVVEPDGIF